MNLIVKKSGKVAADITNFWLIGTLTVKFIFGTYQIFAIFDNLSALKVSKNTRHISSQNSKNSGEIP